MLCLVTLINATFRGGCVSSAGYGIPASKLLSVFLEIMQQDEVTGMRRIFADAGCK